jgi:hypothetical protein
MTRENEFCRFVVEFRTRHQIVYATILGRGTLCYKPEGRRFESRMRCIFNFSNPSSRTVALWSTQPLTEMSTRNLPVGKKRPVRRADNFAAIYERNV